MVDVKNDWKIIFPTAKKRTENKLLVRNAFSVTGQELSHTSTPGGADFISDWTLQPAEFELVT